MANQTAGLEISAVKVLSRAVNLDKEQKFPQALVCYQEGIHLLMEVLPDSSEDKRLKLRNRISEYMDRAEKVKVQVDKEKDSGKYHEEIQIENDATGYDYEKLFKRLLDDAVIFVQVEDPYIMSNHQVYNFLRFCELLVKFCCNLKRISLLTGRADKSPDEEKQQSNRLFKIAKSLNSRGIELQIEFSKTLHDRVIKFSNGWILKIGRGLDIYKASENNYCIGYCDFSLRKCHQTTINIYHSKHTKQSS